LYLTGFHRGRAQLSIKQGFIPKRGGEYMTLLYRVSCRKGYKATRLLNKLSPTLWEWPQEKKLRILHIG
jgi:hypothetical protein